MRLTIAAALAAVFLVAACASEQTGDPAPGPALFVARDADSTLYLYGTIHLRRAGDPWGSSAVDAALGASEEIWTELEMTPENDARVQQLALQMGRAPAGRGLSTWLSPGEAQRLGQTAQRLGLQPQALEPMQPWLAGLTLTMLPMVQAGYDPNAGVDRAIDAFGDAHGKRMRAFETPEQQLGFFAELSPDVQRQMLLEAIDEAEKGPAALDELSAAWERGEIGTLERLLNEDMRTEYPEVYAALISRRNAAWIVMLTHELQGSGVDFVAVGAAHLVGDEGLVAQLRARGIRVERVGAR
jgi:uncharacterized protein YbaP (TraB family)